MTAATFFNGRRPRKSMLILIHYSPGAGHTNAGIVLKVYSGVRLNLK